MHYPHVLFSLGYSQYGAAPRSVDNRAEIGRRFLRGSVISLELHLATKLARFLYDHTYFLLSCNSPRLSDQTCRVEFFLFKKIVE